MIKRSKLFTLMREPLLHFLLIGAGLFFLFSQVNSSKDENRQRIVITKAKLDALATAWLKRKGRPPSSEEREQQLEYYIREQVLYREAMAMGLDKDDVIIRRRLAQKMQYLFDDLSVVSEPTEAELELFLSEHASQFTRPATISFSQVYLDPREHDDNIDEDAKQLLEQLKATTAGVDSIDLGDRSLLPYDFTKERESEIASMFGTAFAKQAFSLPLNSWTEAINSEYGVHFIYIHSRTKDELPPLAEIREKVARDRVSTKQHEANEIFYQSLLQRYEIVLDDDVAKDAKVSTRE